MEQLRVADAGSFDRLLRVLIRGKLEPGKIASRGRSDWQDGEYELLEVVFFFWLDRE